MANSDSAPLNRTQWLICIVAAIGFAFDIYEILVLPLIVRPAIVELGPYAPGTLELNAWVGWLFWIPALTGGIFGLLGGYLTDRFGRRAVLVWSILLYAFSAVAAGMSTSLPMLLFFRCTTFIGVCVEFVAAVAWLAELFPDPKRREAVIGYTQAFSSLGGLMVTGAYYLAVQFGPSLPEIAGGHQAWRYTLISGVIPAIPLIVIRPFLPESPKWREKREAGTLKRPSLTEIFRPELRRATLVTALMFACSYGAAFGALQHLPRIVPGIPGVRGLAGAAVETAVSQVQLHQELGGLIGRLALAFLAVRIVSRRMLIRMFQFPGLFFVPLLFLYATTLTVDVLKWGVFVAGFLTVAQLSFWGNYIPRVYPTHLRGTGESFSANIGGRMLGTSAALLTTQLSNVMPGAIPPTKLAYSAAAVALLVYGSGFLLSFLLPEPPEKLPE
jgi:MFS family permease